MLPPDEKITTLWIRSLSLSISCTRFVWLGLCLTKYWPAATHRHKPTIKNLSRHNDDETSIRKNWKCSARNSSLPTRRAFLEMLTIYGQTHRANVAHVNCILMAKTAANWTIVTRLIIIWNSEERKKRMLSDKKCG